MSYRTPRTDLGTHNVTNQPPPFEDVDIFSQDTALKTAVNQANGAQHVQKLSAFGAQCGSAETIELGFLANQNPPKLKQYDRYGQRIDEVEFHPAYHQLMQLGLNAGISSAAWTEQKNGHTLHAALLFLMSQVDGGVCCPISMTYASVPALQANKKIADEWVPRISSSNYDPSAIPAPEKTGVTIGMAMTEKQGGSDVRANTTKAEQTSDGSFRLTGHKWFCSAPMCDGFLTLAQTKAGLTCFFVPRWTPDGERNMLHIIRLKDKLGDRSNASSEIEYHGAYATLLGEEGHGIKTIINMVNHTRLDCVVGSAGAMRAALNQAQWHAEHRSAFQKRLVDQSAMQAVLSDLALESEAATALAFRLAHSFDKAKDSPEEAAFMRLATPIAKFQICKRQPGFVYEALECLGGAGFVEESIMPRYFRGSPLNSIWEGSGNVIALDILRAIHRETDAIEAVITEIKTANGQNLIFDRFSSRLENWLKPGALSESTARRFAEDIALMLQASSLAKVAPDFVFDGFCQARLDPENRSLVYGALPATVDQTSIVKRASLSNQ